MSTRLIPVTSLLVLIASVTAPVAGAQTSKRPTGILVVSNMRDNTASMLDVATGRVLAPRTRAR